MAYLFLLVHIAWYIVILNHAITLIRIFYYRNLKYEEIKNKDSLPSVTLATVLYKEPSEVVDQFTCAIKQLDYPRDKLTIIAVEDLDNGEKELGNTLRNSRNMASR